MRAPDRPLRRRPSAQGSAMRRRSTSPIDAGRDSEPGALPLGLTHPGEAIGHLRSSARGSVRSALPRERRTAPDRTRARAGQWPAPPRAPDSCRHRLGPPRDPQPRGSERRWPRSWHRGSPRSLAPAEGSAVPASTTPGRVHGVIATAHARARSGAGRDVSPDSPLRPCAGARTLERDEHPGPRLRYGVDSFARWPAAPPSPPTSVRTSGAADSPPA